MSSSPPLILSSIECEVSSGSETLLTPPSPTPTHSTYSRQHNVTPTPEPSIVSLLEGFGGVRISRGHDPQDSEDNLVEDDVDAPRYTLRTESLPDAPIYNAGLQDGLRETKAQLSQLFASIASCPLVADPTRTLFSLGQQIQRLSNFDYPRTRTAGFVGDSGVGKSSLINSILDEEGLARSSGDGGACTNIVTEYRYLPRGREEQYYFEVDYMSLEEVKLLLEDLVSTYRAYFTERAQDVQNVTERETIKDKAERAASALHSLFGGLRDYSEELLRLEDENASQSILSKLMEMAESVQRKRPGGLTSPSWSGSADTVDDLHAKLEVFIRVEGSQDLPIQWPFVSVIRIYLKSLFLRTGIVLADLPGLRDLNYARIRATDRYMRTCHEVFAVTRIDRATTDVSVKDIVNSYGQRPIRIICTRSEEVNARETERSRPAEAAEIKRLRTVVDTTRKNFIRLKRARQSDRTPEANASDDLKQAELNLESYLIHKRNGIVEGSLQDTYSTKVFKNDLRVFCVSNKMYEDAKADEEMMARRGIELSGIPDLRQYCHLITATAQFDAVASFLEHQVPTLLGSVRQWLLQGSDELSAQHASTLRAALANSKSAFLQCNNCVALLQRSLQQEFRANILNTIADCAVEWSKLAVSSNTDRAAWHHSTYAAFCRANGDYATSAVGHHNWNEEIISVTRPDLRHWSENFESIASQRFSFAVEDIRTIFNAQENALKQCHKFAPNAIGNLVTNMSLRMNCIEDLIDTAISDFEEHFCILADSMLEGHPSSYITLLLRATYLACQNEYGRGSDARRKEHMRLRLSKPALFLELRELLREAQKEFFLTFFDRISSEVSAELDLLVADIQTVVCEEGEISESRQYPEIASSMQRSVDRLAQELGVQHRLLLRLRKEREADHE